LGVGRIVENPDQLDDWFSELKDNEKRLTKINRMAKDYMERHEGATEAIVATISAHEG